MHPLPFSLMDTWMLLLSRVWLMDGHTAEWLCWAKAPSTAWTILALWLPLSCQMPSLLPSYAPSACMGQIMLSHACLKLDISHLPEDIILYSIAAHTMATISVSDTEFHSVANCRQQIGSFTAMNAWALRECISNINMQSQVLFIPVAIARLY